MLRTIPLEVGLGSFGRRHDAELFRRGPHIRVRPNTWRRLSPIDLGWVCDHGTTHNTPQGEGREQGDVETSWDPHPYWKDAGMECGKSALCGMRRVGEGHARRCCRTLRCGKGRSCTPVPVGSKCWVPLSDIRSTSTRVWRPSQRNTSSCWRGFRSQTWSLCGFCCCIVLMQDRITSSGW